MTWLIPLSATLAIAALLAYRFFIGKREPGYLAITEYWVYAPEATLPPMEKIMDRMISANPHNRRGNASIGAREGLLFSDIRLHLAVAKRSKNPHIFRPDLFEEHTVPSQEVLARLADCQTMIKLRYLSEVRLKDTRHLQFMPHLVDAIADLTQGKVVFDHTAEYIETTEDFKAKLSQNNNTERPESHVRVVWKHQTDGSQAQTLGLRKIGRPEILTDPQEEDNEVLVTGLLMRLAFHLVRNPDDPGPWDFQEFEDTFIFTPEKPKGGIQTVHLKRKQVQ